MKPLRARALLPAFCLLLLGTACAQQDAGTSAPRSAPSTASKNESGNAEKQKPEAGKPDGGIEKPEVELAADPAPAFEVETFDGNTFAIREELGTPVVLNFWESW